jgi:hypothetical protein
MNGRFPPQKRPGISNLFVIITYQKTISLSHPPFFIIITSKEKIPAFGAGIFIWVIEGARTPDPQNHNLML